MKNKEVFVLIKYGLIPKHLISGHNKAHDSKADPVDEINSSYWFGMLMAALCCLCLIYIAYGVPHPIPNNDEVKSKVLFASVCAILTFAGCIALMSPHQFTRDFGRLVEVLRDECKISWQLIQGDEPEALRDAIMLNLIYKAALVKYCEAEFDMDSLQAGIARIEFDSIFNACQKFDLVEKRKNAYYEQTTGVVISAEDRDRMQKMNEKQPDPVPVPAPAPQS